MPDKTVRICTEITIRRKLTIRKASSVVFAVRFGEEASKKIRGNLSELVVGRAESFYGLP